MITNSMWLSHPKYPDYLFSPEGNILSLKRKTPKIISQSIDKSSGFVRCVLSYDYVMIHRAIAEIYCEGYSDDKWICHLDGNRTNNDFSNLRSMTASENAAYQRDVRGHMGSRGADRSRLTDKDIKKIYKLRFSEMLTYKAIGERFGLTEAAITSICKGHTWRHLWFEESMDRFEAKPRKMRSIRRLTADEIKEIRRLVAVEKVPYSVLSRQFNTSPTMISLIHNRKIWKDL